MTLSRSNTTRATKPQKMSRGLKVCIKKEEGLYYICNENEDTDHLSKSVISSL